MVTKDQILEVVKNFDDPELGIDIYTLGLVYKVDFDESVQDLKLTITFTSPMCPLGPQMVNDLKGRFRSLGLDKVEIEVVFDPPWTLSQEVRQILGM